MTDKYEELGLEQFGIRRAEWLDTRAAMNKYRLGDPLPQQYIELHTRVAIAKMQKFVSDQGCRLLQSEFVRDGWCDSMRVLRLICEDKAGMLRDFRWSDANGGSWFEKLPSGGQTLVEIVRRPGHM